MNVFILAAGLGTRLKPLTDTMPKALVPVAGRPLLQILVDKLKCEFDNPSIVINVHHFGQQIIDYVHQHDSFGLNVQFSDERALLLETGGGLKKAASLFGNDSPILIHNVDILSNLNLFDFYHKHFDEPHVAASLVVSQRETKRYLLFNEDDRLVGWTNIETGEVKTPFKNLNVHACKRYAFSGIHIVNKQVIEMMNEWKNRFPIMDFYLSVCDQLIIKADVRPELKMIDVGKLNSLNQAETMMKNLGL